MVRAVGQHNGAIAAAAITAVGGIVAAAIASGALGGGDDAGGGGGGTTSTVPVTVTMPTIPFPGNASVFVNRDRGPGGTTVLVSGEGFAPGQRVVIRFHTEQIGSTTANAEGRFANVAVTIPTSFSKFAPQQFDIVADGEGIGSHAATPFTITG